MPASTIQIATAAAPAALGGAMHAGKAAGAAASPLGMFESILGGMVEQSAGIAETGVPTASAKAVAAPAPEAALLQATAEITPAGLTVEPPVGPEPSPLAVAKPKITPGAKPAGQPKPEDLVELVLPSATATPPAGAATAPAAATHLASPLAEVAASVDEKLDTPQTSPDVVPAAVDPGLFAALVATPAAPPTSKPIPAPSGEAGGARPEPSAAAPPVLDATPQASAEAGKIASPDPAAQPARPADIDSPRFETAKPATAPSPAAAVPQPEPAVAKTAPAAPSAPLAVQPAAEPVPPTSQPLAAPPPPAPGEASGKPAPKTTRTTRDPASPSPAPGAAPKPTTAGVQTAETATPDAREAKIAALPAAGEEGSPASADPNPPGGTAGPQAPAANTTHAAAPPAAPPVRGSPETVASLAAQMVKKLGARTSHFDVQLDPVGLGRVNVRVEIGADGQVRAAMSFDNPQAAAELKSRASELQRALAQSGFDVSSGGLSFDVAGDPGGSGRQQNAFQNGDQAGSAFRGRAFAAALETAGEAAQSALSNSPYLRLTTPSGVDVRI